MIKKEDYLKAKETVEKYEEQLRIADVMRSANCYNGLKIIEITEKLYRQEIDPNEAERLLLDLFGVISCSCSNGIIVCPGCNGEQSKFGICAGCKGTGIRTCGKCGGKNKI